MKVGVLIPPLSSGGVYQYGQSIIRSLSKYSDKFEYCPIEISFKKISGIRKIIHFLGLVFNINFFILQDSLLFLKEKKIDLLVIPTPFSFNIPLDIPYISAVPDLMHKYYPELPEYNLKERITRDIVYKYFARHSLLNIVDSEWGKRDLSRFFKIKKEKIIAIYFRPTDYIYKYKNMNLEEAGDLLKKYNLPERFIFYPAQFWPHKNHLRLIKAIALIKEKYNKEVPLVLVGSKGENYKEKYNKIISLAEEKGIRKQIIHLGYVSEKDLVALYKKTLALVFCSLGGPTNIPLVEAMVLGVPVLCSDLFEMPKQAGDAGILFNPFDEKDMAEKIYKVWTDENLRDELSKKALEKGKTITLESYARQWEEVISQAFKKLNKNGK